MAQTQYHTARCILRFGARKVKLSRAQVLSPIMRRGVAVACVIEAWVETTAVEVPGLTAACILRLIHLLTD